MLHLEMLQNYQDCEKYLQNNLVIILRYINDKQSELTFLYVHEKGPNFDLLIMISDLRCKKSALKILNFVLKGGELCT